MNKLNVGSGSDYKQGWMNLDFDGHVKADIYHNLNVYPYPFSDNSFDFILCSHILEHLIDPYAFVMEMHRILKPGGEIVFKLPVSSFSYTHLRGIHCKDYFKSLTGKTIYGQSGEYFNLVYQKRRLRQMISLYYRLRNWFLNLFTDEWEYKLKKRRKNE